MTHIGPFRVFLAAPCAALFFCNCGGASGEMRTDNRELASKVAELRAQSRRDRIKIHDLENQMLVKMDWGGGSSSSVGDSSAAAGAGAARSAASHGGGDDDLVPDLPVEVVYPQQRESGAPPDAPPRQQAPSSAAAEGEIYVAGVDEEGVEIVYAGDALARGTVRPSQEQLRAARASSPPSSSTELAPPSADDYAPPRAGDPAADRLPVLSDKNPPATVDKRVREAHAPPPAPDRARPAPRAPRATLGGAEAAADYRRHYQSLRAGEHAAAVSGFTIFLARYPEHEFADNAQYWLGEAYYDQRLFSPALTEFEKVVERYPQGNKVSDALLKIGYCQLALGNLDAGRKALRRVVTTYPTSSPAALAARRLKELEE